MELAAPNYLILLVALPIAILLARRALDWLGTVRGAIVIALRCAVIGLMVLALTAPETVQRSDDQTVVFALDQSDSIPQAELRETDAFVQAAALGMRPDKDRVAAIQFANHARIAQVPASEVHWANLGSLNHTQQTDIAAALRLGLAIFPGETANRLVLMSDGCETRALAKDEADAYAALGIPIDVVPIHYQHKSEILVERLSAPASAKPDDTINLQLIVRSQAKTRARLTLYRNDRLLDLDPRSDAVGLPIDLAVGPNRFSIPVHLTAAGVHQFRAVIQPEDSQVDSIAVNNEGRAFTIVGGATRVLLVSNPESLHGDVDQQAAQVLLEALQRRGVEIQSITVQELPKDPMALADTSAVILSNISAMDLGQQRQQTLAAYVRDQGGGLIVLGGDQAFSVGGYAHTPLEEVLPVETSRDKLQLPSLGLVAVIDCSGSMSGEKLDMARQAAAASIKLLSRLDRVGVIAFSGDYRWVVPLQQASQDPSITNRIRTIGALGGTIMYPALEEACRVLAGTDTSLKHVIVLTDGHSAPGPFLELADSCGAAGITISTVAVSQDADRKLLADIAEHSGGRMYIAESARPLPAIFARETVLASRSGIDERRFKPQLQPTMSTELLSGFSAGDFPPLDGYVLAVSKPLAQTALVRPTQEGADPVLAYWQVGLGRSVAFTSGLWPKWGASWTAWSGFSKFWTQAVDYVALPANPTEFEVETSVVGDEGRVLISAEHLPASVQGSLTLSGQLTAPGAQRVPLALQRTGLGRFEARFPLDTPGTYLVSLPFASRSDSAARSGILRTGIVQSYSAEYRRLRDDPVLLTELAQRTGGRVLSFQQPDAVFEASSVRPIEIRKPAWQFFVQMAMVLFLLDVAVRRLALHPTEAAAQMRQYIHEMAGAQAASVSSEQMAAMQRAKQAAHHERDAYDPDQATFTAAPRESGSSDTPLSTRETAQPAPSEPSKSSSDPDSAAEGDGDVLSRLRAAKRRARGE